MKSIAIELDFIAGTETEKRLRETEKRSRGRHALVCEHRMPEFDRERGSQRALELALCLRSAGWNVSFLSLDTAHDERYSQHLQQLGIAVYRGLDDRVRDALAQGTFDVALVAFWHTAEVIAPLVRELSPRTTVIVDTVDLHCLREARRRFRGFDDQVANHLDEAYGQELVREMNAYAEADGVITVSSKEASLIDDFLGQPGHAQCVPLIEDSPRSKVSFQDRRGIVFVGNFWHRPNREAVQYLCEEIIPRLDPGLLDEHPVSIVGHALDDEVRSYADGLPNVNMIGWVPSVVPYLDQARVAVAPLLHGAGVKGKVLQSVIRGTPMVTTTIGIEGLAVTPGEDLIVADTAVDFARSIVRLLGEDVLWEAIARKGSERLAPLHATSVVQARLLEVVRASISHRWEEDATTGNPASRMLRYESHQASVQKILAQVTEPGCTIAVVCRGDEEMVRIEGRVGTHFPQALEGYFSGFYPADNEAAVTHLEAVRDRGVDYLVFPVASLWWLHHYRIFGRYLTEHYHRMHVDDDCVVFDLRTRSAEPQSTGSTFLTEERPAFDLAALESADATTSCSRSPNGDSPGSGGSSPCPPRRHHEVAHLSTTEDHRVAGFRPETIRSVASRHDLPLDSATPNRDSKIFCIGFGRTGTSSLHVALQRLGLSSLHFGEGVKTHQAVVRAEREGKPLLTYIDDHYDAYSDIGGLIRHFDQADRDYPGSKFILTVRDIDAWLDSRRRKTESNAIRKAHGQYDGYNVTVRLEDWRDEYLAHLNRVNTYFANRPDDLLVIDVCDGHDLYDQLVSFLAGFPSLQLPKEASMESFPWENRFEPFAPVAGPPPHHQG